MVTYAGKNTYCLFGIESTFGTTVSATKDIGTINNVDVEWNNNLNTVYEIGNRESTDLEVGNFDATLNIDGSLNSGAIFELFFGQCWDNATSSDYKHDFVDVSSGTTLLLSNSSFTMTENFNSTSDIEFTYRGCKLNSLNVTLETGGVLSFTAEVLATALNKATTVGTQVTTTTSKLSGFNGVLQTGTEASEATVTLTKSFNLTMTHNIDPADVKAIGSRLNQDLVEKNFDLNVEFTKKFNNTTEFQRFLGGVDVSSGTPTDTSLILNVNNGVTLGSGRIAFYLKAKNGQYETVSHTVSQDGVVEATFNYVGGNIEDCYFVDQVASYF